MNILLHICCGPCAIMPIRRLLEEGHTVAGFFYNPNIHPLAEYLRRREGAAEVAARYGIKMYWALNPTDAALNNACNPDSRNLAVYLDSAYDSQSWLAMTLPAFSKANPGGRCPLCWRQRLQKTAELAARFGFEAFSTSLLYSRRQRHEEIAGTGREIEQGLRQDLSALPKVIEPVFLYRDFRPDWQAGINLSKEWDIYRQPYCGCLFSENDRYARALAESDQKLK